MTKPIPPLSPEVTDALSKGHLLEAVKRLRATTPMGLAEAKKVIEWHLRHNKLGQPLAASSAPAPQAAVGMVTRVPAVHHRPTVHAPARPGLSPGEVARTSGGGMVFVVLLAVAAGLVYYFLR